MDFSRMTQQEMIHHFKEIKSRISELLTNIETEHFNRKPSPKSWSAAECINHLNIAANGYLNNISQFSAGNISAAIKEREYEPRFLARKFIEMTGPESRIKLKAVGMAASQNHFEKNILDDFYNYQDRFLSLIERTGFDQLYSVKVISPFVKLLKFQLGEVIMMTIAHQIRHLNQAERALNIN